MNLKNFFKRIFTVFVGTLLILNLSFAVNGNSVLFTQPANAALTIQFNKDYAGGDYRNIRDIYLKKCMATCEQDSQCKAFVHNPKGINNDGRRVCWLKSKVNPISNVPEQYAVVAGKKTSNS